MDLGIKNKVAIVTGAGRIGGRAVARELLREGANVLLVDSDEASLAASLADLAADHAGFVESCAIDVTNAEGARAAVAAATAKFGAPVILVIDPLPSPPMVGWDSATDEGLRAAHRQWNMALVALAREVLPAMRAQHWGRMLLLLSSAIKTRRRAAPADYGRDLQVGAAALAKTFSHEFGGDGVTANVLALGWIEGIENGLEDVPVPAGRAGRPEEVSALAAFLCSDRAGYVSGEIVRIDGARAGSLF